MSSFITLNPDDLEVGTELTEEDVEQNDANCEVKESDKLLSPFANFLSNLLSGGGRKRRQRILGRIFFRIIYL